MKPLESVLLMLFSGLAGTTAAHAAQPQAAAVSPWRLQPVTLVRGGGAGTAAAAMPAAPWASHVFALDDGSYEDSIGMGTDTPTATQAGAVWLNRFHVAEAVTVDSISILWPTQAAGTLVGLQANLVVYHDADADGDPGNALRIGSDQLVTIAAVGAFQTYPTSFAVAGAGDLYIGFVDQWALAGGYKPRLFPAALDQSSDQGMSWLAAASTPPTDIVDLGANDLLGTSAQFGVPGNWLIRATATSGVSDVIFRDGFETPDAGVAAGGAARS